MNNLVCPRQSGSSARKAYSCAGKKAIFYLKACIDMSTGGLDPPKSPGPGLSAVACSPTNAAQTPMSASGHKQPSGARRRASGIRSGAEFKRPNFRSWGLSRHNSRCAGRPFVAMNGLSDY